MTVRNILAALIMMFATIVTTSAQGFRVYKSDGIVAQFSMRTDSIVFYEGVGSDVDFGPYTPVNQCTLGSAGSYGCYWSRSLLTSYSGGAYYLHFRSGSVDWDYDSRYYGRSVRSVRVSE